MTLPLQRLMHRAGALLAGLWLLLGLAGTAQAVPSYTRQTGQECASCHVGSFGPQLTPYGMKFKIGGYTDSDGGEGKVPLSAMLVGTYTATSKGQPGGAAPRYSDNNNTALQEVSVFLAGKLGEHVGSFSQITYSGIARKSALDHVDIRAAGEARLAGHDVTLGVSLNNNPTLQDPFNTLPAWRFPYTTSDLAPAPGAAPLLDGGLEHTVIGATGYAYLDNGLYAEMGGYTNLSRSFLEKTNVIMDPTDPGKQVKGVAPYWRLGYFKDNKRDAYSVGLVGMSARLGDYGLGGPADRYNDLGVDASYQFLGNRQHVFTVAGSYIHERQKLDATFGGGGADNSRLSLNQWNVSSSYHYNKTYGVTVRYFNITGTQDNTFYGDNRSGRPDSSGWTLQGDWTPFGKESSWGAPWANVRLGLQYTWYNRFNGAKDNYDGSGRNAKDNNTLYGFIWTAF